MHLCLNQPKLAAELATLVLTADDWAQDALVIAAAVEDFVAAGQSDQAQHLLARAVTNGLDPSSPYLLASAGRIDLTNGDLDSAIPRLSEAARVFQQREYRVDETCARLLAVTALAARGKQVAAQAELDRALGLADQCGAAALRRSGRSLGRALQLRLGGTPRVQEQPAHADAGGRDVAGLAGELRLALRQDQLLHYQPKLNLATGRVDAVEGLVRWQHPRLGLIFPDRFVPMAEKAGLISRVTHWVLAAGLEQARDWRECGLHIKVSVNISASDISDPRFAEVVETALERGGGRARPPLPGGHRVPDHEPTRPGAGDPERAQGDRRRAQHRRLRDWPFFTGICSRAAGVRAQDRPVLLHGPRRPQHGRRPRRHRDGPQPGMTVTAEGVENRTALEALAALGCDHAQGLVIGPWILAPALTRRVRREARRFTTQT